MGEFGRRIVNSEDFILKNEDMIDAAAKKAGDPSVSGYELEEIVEKMHKDIGTKVFHSAPTVKLSGNS